MTVTLPDEDLAVSLIDHLDFDVPCDWSHDYWEHGAAAWIISLEAHCPRTIPVTRLICQACYEYVTADGVAACIQCRVTDPVKDYVLRLEPLKSNGASS